MRSLFKFHGGVHPPTHKAESTGSPIAQAALPSKLVIPLHQHVGNRAVPVVQVGEHVLKGQLIGRPEGRLSSAVHASTSGTVSAIDMQLVAHQSGLPDLCITLVPDGKDEWIAHSGVDYRQTAHTDLRHLLRQAGVVGLGGAVFPSDMKSYSHKHKIKTLVLNGAECEPYITCDDMLMRERAGDILRGAEVLRELLYAEEVLIGIEDNKPEAIAAMQQAVLDDRHAHMEVIPVPTLYPGGGAKQLIRVLTGIEVAAGVRSTEMGVQCFNVATAYCVWRAIAFGEPLLSRIVTVTGNVEHAQNFEVLLGTPVDELVAQAGSKPDTDRHIMGGPMMGVDLPSGSVGVTKATNCIIEASPRLFPPLPPALPCIRCTRCADVCPAELQPQDLYWFAKAKDFGKAQEYHLFDCIECGACAYVCPSHIPLVQYYRFAKSEIWQRERESQAAELARERHEFRLMRIEREKQEKAERLAQKEKAALAAKAAAPAPVPEPAIAVAAATADPDDTLQMRIDAAVARAKEQAAAAHPKNTDALTAEQQAEIAAIEARRAKIREMAAHAGADDEPPKSNQG
ncbi:electron transport complex subunit RsxC [Sideroxyarcus emersonii]|uniref:Ion-translocating oxidoreductase complex subunit C n=1 Tax=Sideroxyarcus emersonii TaxID=2764705 RepID=A0AAN2BZZ7_9PROT|nr:electron transport complex subunit RsxC [Sideroxyarcus emersonii]BCK88327.1 electron transport complex subunit RsxC [Sideroxyarcus emersonii]